MGISLQNVSYSYNKKRKIENTIFAIKDITLNIEEKDEFIALVGETGSGKSTLASIFNALKIPTSGDAVIFGIKIKERRKRSENYNNIRKHVGLVFQFPDYQLFEESVLKDVMYGPRNFGKKKDEAEKIAKHALELIKFPVDLYDKSPFILSGGEKKMASIAGILALESDILVFDEPTAGLDPETRNKVINLFKELNQNDHKSIIVITHDMNIVNEYAKRVLVMNDGKLAFDGTPKDLFSLNKDIVKDSHLDYPDTYKIADYLNKNCNMQLDITVKNIDELYEEIIK